MGGLTRRPVRRYIVLDSGGLTHLASGDHFAETFVRALASMYDPPEYRVPDVVLTEVATGHRRYDTKVDRFLKEIDDPQQPGRFWLHMTVEIAQRAGVLRTAASASRAPSAGVISATDAQVVAFAEDLSRTAGVTVVTSDPDDIQDLVNAINPAPRNIAVEGV